MIKCRVTLDENAFQREIEKRDQIDVPMDCVRNKMSEIVRNMIIKDGLEDAVHQCCGAFHVEGFLNIEAILCGDNKNYSALEYLVECAISDPDLYKKAENRAFDSLMEDMQ